MKLINITLLPTGEVQIDAEGFTGASCEEATKAFLDALGGTITDQKIKPEHSMRETQQKQQVKRNA